MHQTIIFIVWNNTELGFLIRASSLHELCLVSYKVHWTIFEAAALRYYFQRMMDLNMNRNRSKSAHWFLTAPKTMIHIRTCRPRAALMYYSNSKWLKGLLPEQRCYSEISAAWNFGVPLIFSIWLLLVKISFNC